MHPYQLCGSENGRTIIQQVLDEIEKPSWEQNKLGVWRCSLTVYKTYLELQALEYDKNTAILGGEECCRPPKLQANEAN